MFASSVAVFGGTLPDSVPDDQVLTPQSSYGAQKAVGEMLVHDYARKGFVDGRSLRLPTITVRPGKPNKAASSFASGIIREPLAGVEAICPVDRATRMWLLSPRAVIDNLIAGYDAPASAFPPSHAINVPGISVTVGEMVDDLRRVAGDAVADRVAFRHDPAIDRIVRTWPRDFDAQRGRALGMRVDARLRVDRAPVHRARRAALRPQWPSRPPPGLNPLAIGQIVARNIVPIVGIIAFGWSAVNVLLLYFIDTLLSMGVMFAGLASWFARRRPTTASPRASTARPARSRSPCSCAPFIAVPLGMPLVFVGAMSGWEGFDGAVEGQRRSSPASPGRSSPRSGRTGRCGRSCTTAAPTSSGSSAASRSCSCAGS